MGKTWVVAAFFCVASGGHETPARDDGAAPREAVAAANAESASIRAIGLPQLPARRTELKGTDGPVFALAWSPDGQRLVSTGHKQVHVWRMGSPAPLRSYQGHTDLVRSAAWSPDATLIASVGDDGVAHVWNAETLLPIATLTTGPERAIAWSPDGKLLATAGASATLQVRNGSGDTLLHRIRLQTTISSLRWSPDGTQVVVGGINGMTTLWDAPSGRMVAKMYVSWPSRNDVNGVTWSPHGRLVAVAHGARGIGGITFWDPSQGTVSHELTDAGGWLRGIAWSPDGQWLAAGGEDGNVRIVNVETSAVVHTLPTDSRPVWSVAWSPDGRRLAAGNSGTPGPPRVGGTVSVWDEPVAVLGADRARARAREIEAALIDRRVIAPATTRPVPIATAFTDGDALGTVMRLEPPFGNLDTSFIEADLRSLAIGAGSSFDMRCREKLVTARLGEHWAEVAPGAWVAYFSLEGNLIIAVNAGSAGESSGCGPGDAVRLSRGNQP